MRRQDGFTLIELLVVILIIGILAAIALPTFLGQRPRAQDANAKSDARNLVSLVEACAATHGDYTLCDTLIELNAAGTEPIGIPYGPGAGEAEILNATATGYDAVARSRSNSTFTIQRRQAPSFTRVCTPTATGGCPASGSW